MPIQFPQRQGRIKPYWISRGLVYASLGNGLFWTKAQRWTGALLFNGGPKKRAHPLGQSFGIGTAYGSGTTDRVDGPVLTTSIAQRSIVFWAFANSVGSGSRGRVFQGDGQTGDGIQNESLFAINSSTQEYSYCRIGSIAVNGQWGWMTAASSTAGPELNKWNCFGLSHNQASSGNTPVMYKNGAACAVNTATASTGTLTQNTNITNIGNRSTDNARGYDGMLGPMYIFDHPAAPLTAAEHALLAANPMLLFEDVEESEGFTTVAGDYVLACDPGVFTITGYDVNFLTQGYTMVADTASFVITGNNANLVGPGITISFDYERANGDPALSGVVGTGDSAVISVQGFVSENETSGTKMLQVGVQATGVLGFRPTFSFLELMPFSSTNHHHGSIASNQRFKFSYDRETWTSMDTISIGPGSSTRVDVRHNTAFTQNTVWVAENRQVNVTQTGQKIADLAAAHSFIQPVGFAFTPVNTTSFPAQSFIVGEFSPQTTLDGRVSPYLPLWAYVINDTSLGSSKALGWLASGVHSGEDIGNWAHLRRIDFICSSDPEAIEIRRNYKIYVIPMINPVGRYLGTFRSSPEQGPGGIDDANRNFSDTLPVGIEVVDIPRGVIEAVMAAETGTKAWAFDDHGSPLNPWEVYEDAGNVLQATFRSRLTTNSGITFVDGGSTPAGAVSRYFENQGFPLAATIEHGNLSRTTEDDASFVTAASAFGVTLNSMREDGLIPGGANILVAETGVFTITGYPANFLTSSTIMQAETGAFVITGYDANLIGPGAYELEAETAVFTITGYPATLTIDTPPEYYSMSVASIRIGSGMM